MKVNTDGVLLGALASANAPRHILDIGTGTGVIALMLAQRFPDAEIDAVEIDPRAAATAHLNFENSDFKPRLKVFPTSFEVFFQNHPNKRYDLIVSNPPFFLNSLASPGVKRNLARHTDATFFERLVKIAVTHLSETGVFALVLPLETAALFVKLLPGYNIHLQHVISVKSFGESKPHREIITLGRNQLPLKQGQLIIYDEPKVYTNTYGMLLKDFLTIF